MVFSENQATQFYVATANSANNGAVASTDTAGTIGVKYNSASSSLYFNIKGADTLLRSDLIKKENILWAKSVKAADMQTKRKKVTLKLNSEVNEGQPVAGQDYTLNIFFRQYIGISDEDIHVKTAAVHAYSGMKDTEFYLKMAASLWLNFCKELTPLVSFTVGGKVVSGVKTNSNGVKMPVYIDTADGNKVKFITGTDAGIVITEEEQEWTLGIKEQVPVYFEVHPTTIYVDGDERSWGTTEAGTTDTPIGNGKKIADMEYFFMGERGDQYRNIGWPKSIPTKYLVDPSKEYNTLNIHYAYVGSNESVQKSEKEIMIVCADKVVMNTLIGSINDATGLSIETV